MHDWKVLNKLTVEYIVANELMYHATCLVVYVDGVSRLVLQEQIHAIKILATNLCRGVGND